MQEFNVHFALVDAHNRTAVLLENFRFCKRLRRFFFCKVPMNYWQHKGNWPKIISLNINRLSAYIKTLRVIIGNFHQSLNSDGMPSCSYNSSLSCKAF